MSEDVKLKPCPFCGCGQDIEKNVSASGTVWFSCYDCGASGPFHDDEKTDADRWNLRAPEPGTSVIRWTRYDGTPETLPCTWTEKEGAKFVLLKRKNRDVCEDHLVATQSTDSFYEWYSCSREPEIGDLWAYLPEPPEGME